MILVSPLAWSEDIGAVWRQHALVGSLRES
jgi:hypothetical protein